MATLTAPTTQEPPADAVQLAIAIERVQLAFDEKVVLSDVSFNLLEEHTKIILGASESGKSITLKIIAGLLRPDARRGHGEWPPR